MVSEVLCGGAMSQIKAVARQPQKNGAWHLPETGFHHRSGRDRYAHFERGFDRQRPVFHLGMMGGSQD